MDKQIKEKLLTLKEALSLSKEQIEAEFNANGLLLVQLPHRDRLVLELVQGTYYFVGETREVKHLSVYYLEYAGDEDGKPAFYTEATYYFPPAQVKEATAHFFERLRGNAISKNWRAGMSLEEIYQLQEKSCPSTP